MHLEKMHHLLLLEIWIENFSTDSEKCFGAEQTSTLSHMTGGLSHVDLIFHFHKYFSPVAKKYLFEVKQILLTDLFVSHLAPFEFDTVTRFMALVLITAGCQTEQRAAVACR